MLAALGGAERQLTMHARAALRNGVASAELLALAEHVSVYAGFPRALNALGSWWKFCAPWWSGLTWEASERRVGCWVRGLCPGVCAGGGGSVRCGWW